ncbi:hypothetical protein EV424DRAFT_1570091 [Suillus variegatus]|nr:hypothetical protein EV424DRAFT_1570091 [Suillus variegatus]
MVVQAISIIWRMLERPDTLPASDLPLAAGPKLNVARPGTWVAFKKARTGWEVRATGFCLGLGLGASGGGGHTRHLVDVPLGAHAWGTFLKETIALRAEVDELHTHLTNMIQSAPSEDDKERIPEKEEWCKNFFNLKNKLITHLMLVRDNKVVIDLPIAIRQDKQKGNLLCVAFQYQVSIFKDAVAKQAKLALKEMAATSTTAAATATTTSKECAPILGETEDNDQEQEIQLEAEEESGEIDERQDDEDKEAPPIEKLGLVGQKKCTPCMSTKRDIHKVPCVTCKKIDCMCHVSSKGVSCYECYTGKAKCSHVQDKEKQKTTVPPPPPPPPLAPKPKPRQKPVALTSHPVRAFLKATQAHCASRTMPTLSFGPSSKWKVAVIKEEESKKDKEDAYLAGRVSGLSNISR